LWLVQTSIEHALFQHMRQLRLLLAGPLLALPLRAQAPRALSDPAFAALSSQLSEAPGFFNTDNLISNEDSYLHVVGTIKRIGVTGGAYIGVGPDQNFSYIAAVRPHVAFLIDIRRDNLLEHLLFKSLFALSRDRLEYLCFLFAKPAPADTTGWGARDIGALLAYIDTVHADSGVATRDLSRVFDQVKRGTVSLSPLDLATINRFHLAFVAAGPSLRFNTLGRAPQWYYPDFRRLAVETDRTGRQSSFLGHESDFQSVKSLEDRNLVIPVVGDLAGSKALAAIGDWVRSQNETISAFYTSNVEQYLFTDGTFAQFSHTVARLPRNANSVMIRSYFRGGHPQSVAGYHATQLLQSLDAFAKVEAGGGFGSYWSLVTVALIDPD
jgi:hypothetical protein